MMTKEERSDLIRAINFEMDITGPGVSDLHQKTDAEILELARALGVTESA